MTVARDATRTGVVIINALGLSRRDRAERWVRARRTFELAMRHCARGKGNDAHRSSVSRSLASTDARASSASKIASRRDRNPAAVGEAIARARVVSHARPKTRERDARDARRKILVRRRDGGFATHRSRTLARVDVRGRGDERDGTKCARVAPLTIWPIVNLRMSKQCELISTEH